MNATWLPVILGAITAVLAPFAWRLGRWLGRRWKAARRPLPCGPGRCHSPLGCFAPSCYGRLRYPPDPTPPPGWAGKWPPADPPAGPCDSDRLWREFDAPGLPYPDWYRPEDDRAAQLPGAAVHGAGAARYFAARMHDHSRGVQNCPACNAQKGQGGG